VLCSFLSSPQQLRGTQEGNVKRARQCFKAAIVACDTHAAAYHGWGQLEMSERRHDAARQVLLKGIKMTKANPNPYLYAAIANLAITTGRALSLSIKLFCMDLASREHRMLRR
jgi:hypothetical protein